MTFTLELTPEQAERLQADAVRSNMTVDEYILRRLFGETAWQPNDEMARLAAIDRAMGVLVGSGLSSENLMREKHEEIEHDEIRWRQRNGLRAE